MTTGQVKDFFCDKENVPSPLTEKLVKADYQQKILEIVIRYE